MRVADRPYRGTPHCRRPAAVAVVAATITMSLAGCGHGGVAGGAAASRPSRVALPARLNPDGSVPWVNAPAVNADFQIPPAPPPVPVGPFCRAGQLTAVLDRWISENVPGEPEDPVNRASLFGSVVLTNTSGTSCTLRGTPSVRLLSSGQVVSIPYWKLGAASTPKVGLPAGGRASFLLHWEAPYCGLPRGPFAIDAALASLRLHVAIDHQAMPGCLFGGSHANGGLGVSEIGPGTGAPPIPPPSPLRRLKAAATGAPATVRPGQVVHFVVALTNPTSAPISLGGRPGYSLEIFCRGTHGRMGLNYDLLYLLNNRAVPVIAPHATVRFDMTVHLTARPFPGPTLDVTWRLLSAAIWGAAPWALLQMRTLR